MDMRFFGKEIHMERGGNIIEAVINMATSLGIMVIAEGVENEREANFLKEIQCPVVQGYLYGKPMPVEAFESRMQTEELGQKSFNRSIEQSIANMYWKMEKYDLLLKNEEVALLDYDPFYDVAVYTYIGENEKRKETSVKNYSSMLMENPKIHPDYRRKLKNILQKGKEYRTEIQYLADYDQTGSYEWCYGVVYHYHHAGEYKRMIAVLKRGIGADTEKLPVSSF
jgi:hypothetical protein